MEQIIIKVTSTDVNQVKRMRSTVLLVTNLARVRSENFCLGLRRQWKVRRPLTNSSNWASLREWIQMILSTGVAPSIYLPSRMDPVNLPTSTVSVPHVGTLLSPNSCVGQERKEKSRDLNVLKCDKKPTWDKKISICGLVWPQIQDCNIKNQNSGVQ